jgi:AcrR family transcriptional regulator
MTRPTRKKPAHRAGARARPGAPRRTRRQGIARIEEILDAARHLLATEGYAEFTLRRIAREVNIRLSTLQHYYPSKDDLFRALVERTVTNYDAVYVRRSGEWGPTARARLAGMVRYLVEDQRKPESHGFFVEFWTRARRDPEAARLLHQAYRQHRDRIRIAMAPLNPSLSGRTAELRAAIVAAMIEGLVVFFAGDQPRDPALEGLEEEIERWVLRMARER